MKEKFHDQLKTLSQEVIKMGNLSTQMLQKSVESLKNQNDTTAEWVLNQKGKLADYDTKIEAKALQLLTLHQPLASDMREIACILKTITYLTRVGRYGKDIAKISKELSKQPPVKKLVSIPYMADIVCKMINDALQAFEKKDISYIKDFADRDDSVDELRYSIFRECLTYMMEDQKTIHRCTSYVMVARYLERCADHALKIGEKIHYMVTGDLIEIDVKKINS